MADAPRDQVSGAGTRDDLQEERRGGCIDRPSPRRQPGQAAVDGRQRMGVNQVFDGNYEFGRYDELSRWGLGGSATGTIDGHTDEDVDGDISGHVGRGRSRYQASGEISDV